jgi:hypothetical protein
MAWFWLKAVPWSTIIANAPQLVNSARKIIERRNVGQAEIDPSATDPAALARRVQVLEARQQQIAELVESLAKSNEQLIQAIQYVKLRLTWAIRAVFLLALIALALAGWIVLR